MLPRHDTVEGRREFADLLTQKLNGVQQKQKQPEQITEEYDRIVKKESRARDPIANPYNAPAADDEWAAQVDEGKSLSIVFLLCSLITELAGV